MFELPVISDKLKEKQDKWYDSFFIKDIYSQAGNYNLVTLKEKNTLNL